MKLLSNSFEDCPRKGKKDFFICSSAAIDKVFLSISTYKREGGKTREATQQRLDSEKNFEVLLIRDTLYPARSANRLLIIKQQGLKEAG